MVKRKEGALREEKKRKERKEASRFFSQKKRGERETGSRREKEKPAYFIDEGERKNAFPDLEKR